MSALSSRSLARRCVVQALYQWQVSRENLAEIERQFREEHGLGKARANLFKELLHAIPKNLNALDEAIMQYADRPVEQIDLVERAILRLGAYELLFKRETPYRVILNEAINLAKEMGAEQSHKYVNGILDKLAHQCRQIEVAADKKTV